MAGLLGDFFGGGQQRNGMGILGVQQPLEKPSGWDIASLLAATAADSYAGYRGQPGGNVAGAVQNMQNTQVQKARGRLIEDLQSPDPQTRQRAYMFAQLQGIDTKPFQQQQANQQLPALLQSMRPSTQSMPGASATLNDGSQLNTDPISFQNPGLNISEAIQEAPPELQAQYAPKLLENQIAAEADANKPFELSPGQHRFVGGKEVASLPEKNNPNQPFNVDGTPNKAYQQYQRDLKAFEASVSPQNTANNPFGKGMTGKAYALLAAGAKDPAVRATPEYMTAWQILSNPKVDPNTGTIIVPDLSAYQPPDGVARGQGGQAQQRMPSLQAFAPPNPSQADAASAGYANRLSDSTSQIDKNEAALSDFWQNQRAKTPVVGNYLTSPEYQKGDQAERNFINAQLRRESGAAIAESEFANARKQYIPQPGDSKEVLAQKRASRAMAVRNMQLSAGNTLLPPGVIQNASPPRGAPLVPMEQGFGGPPPPANLPRMGAPKIIRYDAQGNRVR